MVYLVCRFGKNVFLSILFLAVISCNLFSDAAFSDETSVEVKLAQGKKDYAQASALRKSQKFADSKALFLSVAENTSGSELAINSLANAFYCELRMGNIDAADQLYEKIKNDYSTHKKFLAGIGSCASSYLYARKFDKAKQAYQIVFTNTDDSNLKLSSQTRIVACQIRLAEYASAENTINDIITQFPEHAKLNSMISSFAYSYHAQKKYDKAKEYYQFVLDNSNNSNLIFDALRKITEYEMAAKNYDAADQLIEVLKNTHSGNPLFYKIICDFANKYLNLQKFKKAGDLYKCAAESSTDLKQAFNAQFRLMECEIRLGHDSSAEKAIAIFMKNHAQHPAFKVKIYSIMNLLERIMKKYDKAIEFYQYIINNSSDRELLFKSWEGIVRCEMMSKNHAAAEQAIKILMTDFSTYPGIDEAMGRIGSRYLFEMRFAKWQNREEDWKIYQDLSNKFCKLFIKEYPNSDFAVEASCVIMKQSLMDNGNSDSVGDEFKTFLADKSKDPRYLSYLECILNINTDFEEKYKSYIINDFKNKIANYPALKDKKNGIEFLIKFSTPSNYRNVLSEYTVFCASNGHCRSFISTIDLLVESEGKHLINKLYELYLKTDQSAMNRTLVTLRLYESKINEGTGDSGILELLEKFIVQNKTSNKELTCKAMFLKGRAYVNLGDIEKARETFEIYKKQNPEAQNMPEVLYYIGYSHLIQGDFEQAKNLFYKILSDYPKSDYASKAKEYIDRINASV